MDRALIHQGDILLWEQFSDLPRGIPESQRGQGSKGRQLVGTEICKDEKRKGGAEPFCLIHSLQLGTQRSLPKLVSVITQATLPVPQ